MTGKTSVIAGTGCHRVRDEIPDAIRCFDQVRTGKVGVARRGAVPATRRRAVSGAGLSGSIRHEPASGSCRGRMGRRRLSRSWRRPARRRGCARARHRARADQLRAPALPHRARRAALGRGPRADARVRGDGARRRARGAALSGRTRRPGGVAGRPQPPSGSGMR